ncbi:MAG: hypothetical protein V9G19_04430 [Tetrasphaera sp.]
MEREQQPPHQQEHQDQLAEGTATAAALERSQEQQRVKTLGIRIEESLHAQLTFVAQLGGNTIADEIRRSIEERVQTAQNDPDLIARAAEVNREIEREAEARRVAIAGFLGSVAATDGVATPASPEPAKSTTRRRL